MTDMLEKLKHARRVSVPLVAVSTADQAATMAEVAAQFGGNGKPAPVVAFDIVRGCWPVNELGKREADKANECEGNVVQFLVMASKFSPGTIAFLLNAQAWIDEAPVYQAVWNLRDAYKQNQRMLMLIGPYVKIPVALSNDVVSLDEELPDEDALERIVRTQDDAANVCGGCRGTGTAGGGKCPQCRGTGKRANRAAASDETVERVTEAVRGLSAFAAEQVVAMSLRPDGIDVESAWDLKRKQIEQTPGLMFDRGTETFMDIGGLSQFKQFGQMLFNGPHPPTCVVRVEEIEKVMSGAAGDSSGTSQDALQVLLNSMEDNQWAGVIAFGPPGSGKSLSSKALANTFDRISLVLDLNACKGSLVGQSEERVRQVIKVIKSVGGKSVFWMATCNSMDNIPPELRRRFRYGTWMFDLPDESEREAIWKIQLAKWELGVRSKRPDDGDYTGADIRSVCELAWRFGCSPADAAKFVAPVKRTSLAAIERTRKAADGKFLSASHPGLYKMDVTSEQRSIEV